MHARNFRGGHSRRGADDGGGAESHHGGSEAGGQQAAENAEAGEKPQHRDGGRG